MTSNVNVLVVDDEAIQAQQVAAYLMRHGFSAVTEHDGSSALAAIAACRPAIIVMDIRMPGLDGISIAEKLSAMPERPKIILVSGYPDSVYDANRTHLDVHAVIHKPIPLRVLRGFVAEVMAGLNSAGP